MKFENQYLTYDEYVGIGGTISQMPFDLLEYEAEKKVDELTFKRFRSLKEYPQELKLCIYKLISLSSNEDDSNVVSETIGNYSVQKQTKEQIEKDKNTIVNKYLSGVKVNGIDVLYRGADLDEN